MNAPANAPARLAALATWLLLLAAPAAALQAAPRLVDASEGGAAMRFDVLPGSPGEAVWTVRIELLDDAAWDRLDLIVEGAAPGERLSFVVADAPRGLAPHLALEGFRWKPLETSTRSVAGGTRELSFALDAPRPRFLVRLDGGAPASTEAAYYTVARFAEYVQQIRQEPLAQVSELGTSVQGRPLLRIVIDPPSPRPKKTVLMAVRQHGDEFGSSYLLEGALDLLLGRNGLTPEPELLERVRWVIYPLVNPDGAASNARTNARGFDLNREWDRNGANAATQEPEIFTFQSDVEALEALWGFDVAGDHHGWTFGSHGGYRYALGQGVSFVAANEYQEARKDTELCTLHDPTQTNWQENGGVTGMLRAEMFHRFGFLIHTPEYDSFLSAPSLFYEKGQAWVRAMQDTLYAPRFSDADGVERGLFFLPADAVHVTVDDLDENQLPGEAEALSVVVRDAVSGDVETLVLGEVGLDSGLFRNSLPLPLAGVPLAVGAPTPENGVLEALPGSRLRVDYVDDDFPRDASSATAQVRPTLAAPAPQPR